MSPRRALIVGLGAIGNSIALALRDSWEFTFIDKPDVTDFLGVTKGRGHFDDDVDITILATPEDAALELLPQTRGVVTSVCSLMGPLRRAATGEFVAGHPMAGTEKSGVAGANARMFVDTIWYLDREHPMARQLAEDCGATVEIIDTEEHDRRVALGSHLPQVLSTALAAYLHGKDPISGPGLKTFLRLAGSGIEMWKPLIADNRDNIAPHAEGVARVVREMLEGDPAEAFRKANELYETLK